MTLKPPKPGQNPFIPPPPPKLPHPIPGSGGVSAGGRGTASVLGGGGGRGWGGPLGAGQRHLLSFGGVFPTVGAENHPVELRDTAPVEPVPDPHVRVALQERPLGGHRGVRGSSRSLRGSPRGHMGGYRGSGGPSTNLDIGMALQERPLGGHRSPLRGPLDTPLPLAAVQK